MPKQVRGSSLRPIQQVHVRSLFTHRYTGDHTPEWVRKSKTPVPLQFKDDEDWLANTWFWVTNDTENLTRTHKTCVSNPTWPNNPELVR